jgi:2-desacetyl-2-hydroxyethyl bacteriochlorophyllide A dehydrogenase
MSLSLTARAIVMKEPNVWVRETQTVPEPGHGEVLVTVGTIGVCGTDFHAFGGNQPLFTYPRVPGHELGVKVARLGPGCEGSGLSVGDHCAVEPYIGCGDCVACRGGKPNCCLSISVLGVHIDGGLKTQLVLPANKCHRSAKKLPLDELAVVEPLCIAAHAVFRAGCAAGENVLVIGAGPVGMGVCQFALANGSNLLAMDISDHRLAFVREQIGVAATMNPMVSGSKDDGEVIVRAVMEHFGGELPTCVIDATGAPPSMEKAFEYVAHGGRICFVGHSKKSITFANPLFHQREMTILGSRNALGADFDRTIALIEEGKVDVKPWITHRCKFDDFEANFAEWLKPETGVIKALCELSMDSASL